MTSLRHFTVMFLAVLGCNSPACTAIAQTPGRTVVIRPAEGSARVVALEVVADNIVRVRATSADRLPDKPRSLMIVQQTGKPRYGVRQDDSIVCVSAPRVQAVIEKRSGRIHFADGQGKPLACEAVGGKRFWPYQVSAREIGVDSSRVSLAQRRGLTWQLVFDAADDALYGLGQHQSEELNMRGRNEDLFQYNTKVSVPFVISSRGYGVLWDSYSYCRFGQPHDYQQLGRVLRLYDKDGLEGHLTGTYTDKTNRQVVRQEDSIYFEYDLPGRQQHLDDGGIKNLPENFKLNGSKVVYEGFIEGALDTEGITPTTYDFILYYAGYVKVYMDGKLVVPERWRTAWNPNSYKFSAAISSTTKTHLRIEWLPDGDVSYLGLRVAKPRPWHEQQQMSIWSEMAQDMDYYFIAGETMDQVIGGYRTLTGRAPVWPKWALGYWQSRERYKTQDELLATLSEFRRRHLPIDCIVQDWNYWPEDQWGSHDFDPERYPAPRHMLDSVHAMHARLMLSVWPKFYVGTNHYRQLDRQGWIYRQAVADDIHDWVGRGYVGSFYDAYSAGARQLFWQQLDTKLCTGLQNPLSPHDENKGTIDAWWMDASEPNVRDCTPMWYRKALCGPTALGTSTEYFNAYALVNAQAIYEGQRSTLPDSRVMQLTRSGFAGLQRYGAATWSGDIGTRWEDMRAQMTAGMNYSLSGLPFWGMDAGGFCVESRYVRAQQRYDRTRQEDEDLREWRELQTRWAQFAAFVPLYRAHGQWPRREPWHIAPDDHPAYRSFAYYDRLRYRLMPYLYSMAGWVWMNDYTMMRALVMDYGDDPQVLDIKDQWMLGPSLMACPVSTYGTRSRTVYLPRSCGWYDIYTGRHADGGQHVEADAPYERIPVFVPEGAIIPFGPAMEWTDEVSADTIQLFVYGGRDGQFTLYEDDGASNHYERGAFSTISISYDEQARRVTIGRRHGSYPGMSRKRLFRIVYTDKDRPTPLDLTRTRATTVEYSGKAVTIRL